MLKTFVKIGNVRSLSDARYCAGMMVDVIGFNLDPNDPDGMSREDVDEIIGWVAGVDFAGEFHKATSSEIKQIILDHPLTYIETSDIEQIETLSLLGKKLIYRLEINSETDIEQMDTKLSYLDELATLVLFQCENPALFEKLDSKIGFYNGNIRLVKGYGVSPEEGIHKFPGIAMEATEEERPGFKDYGQVMDVLEFIESED